MRRTVVRFSLLAAVLSAGACVQSAATTQEYINAPIGLTLTLVATQTYEASFYSDNREGGFVGYGVFTGASADALNTAPADMPTEITAATKMCNVNAQIVYATKVSFQIGPSATGLAAKTALCEITDLTLTPGSYIALRARVERTLKPWSAAAIAQVP